MAETLGSLIDKFSISIIRLDNVTPELKNLVMIQKEDLKNEIDEYLQNAINGSVRLLEPKFKNYNGENASNIKSNSIGTAISNLMKSNSTLWRLEDERRDKNKSNREVRVICNDVARFNRIRNDSIDEINKLLSDLINKKNP